MKIDKIYNAQIFLWLQLKNVQLTSSASSFSSGQISSTKKYLWVQASYDVISGGGVGIMKAGTGGSLSGSICATRFSHDAGSDSTQTSVSYGIVSPSSDGASKVFVNCFIINKSDQEKLCIAEGIDMSDTGAGTTPNRTESVTKWANTSAQLDIFNFSQADGGNVNNGQMTIWGFD